MKEILEKKLQEIVKKLTDLDISVQLSVPKDISKGDFTTNVAFQIGKSSGKNPMEVAKLIAEEFNTVISKQSDKNNEIVASQAPRNDVLIGIEKVEAVAPGFINFYLSNDYLSTHLEQVLATPEKIAGIRKTENKKVMVEFAHPNTHKELHIGHMRTLTTGESLARIFEANGVRVFRANYQGDIGPHVAKAMYGVEKMMQEQNVSLDEVEKLSYSQKAHFLGQGYARGSKDYEEGAKEEIDRINVALYKRAPEFQKLYQLTRKWSLDYYDEFYKRFYTKFDKLFFEGDLDKEAVRVVEENVGKVFTRDADGSIVFKGEQYGLHTRVFITQKGTPTYEGKEIALGFAEYAAFPFDLKIHVVASEQTGYFQVVFKALELIDPKKFEGHESHLSMGMVQLVGRKMSSRTGDVLTVDELLDKVKQAASEQFKEGKLDEKEKDTVLEQVTIGAVKYAILKGGVTKNALFDIEESVSLNGNSGPYVQYAYTRTQSVLEKADSVIANEVKQSSVGNKGIAADFSSPRTIAFQARLSKDYTPQEEEKMLMRKLVQFPEIVANAAREYAPNIVCEYLFELSQMFNNFYQKYRIVNAPKDEEKQFRLGLTAGVGIVLQQGLMLLGMQAPKKM